MSLSRPLLVASLFLAACLETRVTCAAEPPSTAASCNDAQSSLKLLACRLAGGLTAAAQGASVTIVELKSDRELPSEPALRERLQSAVLMALRPGDPSKTTSSRRLSVELRVEKQGGVLRVDAELRRATGLWQRIRQAKPRAEQRAFAEVPLDAELRSLIPPPPLVVSETLKLKAPERGIVAMACGPVGAEGAQELLLVTRASVRIGRIAGRAFQERKKVAWSALSAVAPAPLREPIGTASLTASGTLRVGITDRKDGVELSPNLDVVRRFEGQLPLPGGGCSARDGLGLAARLSPCDAREHGATGKPALDAVAGTAAVQVGRELGTSRLTQLPSGTISTPTRAGAQLALADADSDGDTELAYALDTLDAARDKLSLVTLRGNEALSRFELPAPDIRAVTICSRREGPRMAPIVVATGDELWLLR
jgi:hypothetical protein